MKKIKFCILVLIVLLFTVSVAFAEDNSTVYVEDSVNLNTVDVVNQTSVGDINISYTIQSNDLVKYYCNDSQFVVRLLDNNNIPIFNKTVTFNINGGSYKRITDVNGFAELCISLAPGKYLINSTFQNTTVFNNVVVLSLIQSNDLVKYFRNDSQFVVRLLDKKGNPVAKTSISFNINGVIYKRLTDVDGFAGLSISLAPKNYIITTFTNNFAYSNFITVLPVVIGEDLVKYYCNDSQFVVSLLDKQGNPVSGKTVTFNINGVFYNKVSNSSGLAKLNINLRQGNYIISSMYDGMITSNNITVLPVISSNNLVKYYCNDSQFVVSLLDKQGNPVSGKTVTFNINGVFYSKVSDNLGHAQLNINLYPGNYIISSMYDGMITSNKIVVLSRIIQISGNVETFYGEETPFKFKILNKSGSPLKNSTVNYKINGVSYKNYTDDYGIATLNLNLNAGYYGISYNVDDISGTNSYIVKNSVKLEVFYWGNGGIVTKNKYIRNNLPKSDLINNLIAEAKYGTPMITFKGGEGKTVFLTAGVHGNELPSQVAMLRLINSFETNPIKGTVHIIPFVCPKDTELNIRRYNGVDLNRVANVEGTVSYNIVDLIVKLKCDAYGDFHSTQSPGIPGRDVILGVGSQPSGNIEMAMEVSKLTGMPYDLTLLSGDLYYGALNVQANIFGIPAINSEVISIPGGIDRGSDYKSAMQMTAFLQYNGII